MTTIVVDSKVGVMAADRRQVSNNGDTIMAGECKIKELELEDGIHLVACSGHESPAAIFLDWYENGDWDETPDIVDLDQEEGFEAVILAPDGTLSFADRFMNPIEIPDRIYATGTGGPYAWAVLKAGCGIEKAIKTAISLDPYSGDGYDIVYLHEVNEELSGRYAGQ